MTDPEKLIYDLIDSSIAAGIDYIRAKAKKQPPGTRHLYEIAADKLLDARKALKVANGSSN